MIENEEARRRVLAHLAEREADSRKMADLRTNLSTSEREVPGLGPEEDVLGLVLIEDATIEEDFGWVFFYQSQRYLESGDVSDMLAGNAPIIVSRVDGSLHETGTAHSLEFYVENFKRSGNPNG